MNWLINRVMKCKLQSQQNKLKGKTVFRLDTCTYRSQMSNCWEPFINLTLCVCVCVCVGVCMCLCMYIYLCVCVCVCVYIIYIYIYIIFPALYAYHVAVIKALVDVACASKSSYKWNHICQHISACYTWCRYIRNMLTYRCR